MYPSTYLDPLLLKNIQSFLTELSSKTRYSGIRPAHQEVHIRPGVHLVVSRHVDLLFHSLQEGPDLRKLCWHLGIDWKFGRR